MATTHTTHPSPEVYARAMAQTFPDLPECAALEIGAPIDRLPLLAGSGRRVERYTRDDYNWDADKRWLRGKW